MDPFTGDFAREEPPREKKRGRPPGAKNKPKEPAPKPKSEGQREARPLTAWLDETDAEPVAPKRPAAEPEAPPQRPTPLDREIERLSDELQSFDFRAFGTKPRFGLFIVEDNSPSEQPHEAEWAEGSRVIPVEIRKNVAARNLIDVAMFTGAEDFRFVAAAHGKDFALPEGPVRYGSGTFAIPWLRGIRSAVGAYRKCLQAQTIEVREVVVVIASDFCFGDDFRGELAEFKGWAKANRVTVVPAGFGAWQPQIATEFGLGEVPPVNLKEVSFAKFFRVLSQSAVTASQAQPGASTAKILADGFKAVTITDPDE